MSFLTRLLGLEIARGVTAVKERYDPPPTEPEYPLRLGLGKTIQFGVIADHVLAETSLRTRLPQGDVVVQAIGVFQIAGIKYYRVYVSDESDDVFILQLELQKDSKEQIHEAILFSIDAEVEPQSEADWGMWIAQGGLIGNINVAPYPDAPADELYVRTIRPQAGEYIDPLKCRERIRRLVEIETGGRIAVKTEDVDHTFMIYGRTVGYDGGNCIEHNLLTTVEAEVGDEASILILVGLSVEPIIINVL